MAGMTGMAPPVNQGLAKRSDRAIVSLDTGGGYMPSTGLAPMLRQ